MLIFLLVFLLISNAVTVRRDKSILFSRIVIKSFLLISFLAYNNLHIKPLENGIGLFGGLFNVTVFTQSLNIFILIMSAIILILSAFYPRRRLITLVQYNNLNIKTNSLDYNSSFNETANYTNTSILPNLNDNYDNPYFVSNKTGEQFRIIEYALIIVFIVCGALFLISSGDLISVFLAIELQSYGLYILATLYRNSESATSSGLTYFLLGGLSSCFILLGSALLYANSGTTSLDNIYVITGISDIKGLSAITYLYQPYYFNLSLVIMFVGLLFKVSAAPFHFWSPDVYDGIPTIVTTYVAIITKISLFAFFLELVYYTEDNVYDFSWKYIFTLSSLLSLLIGSMLGLTQFRIKRLFAYSTINHVGFILLALSINTTESIQSYIFYIIQYSVSNLNAFIILVAIGYTLYMYVNKYKDDREDLIDRNNSPVQHISQIKGYFYINPFIAISLSITLFSFVGIPPVMGFFAKQMVLSAALDSGYVFMTITAILTSVVGAVYYLNLIKEIFFNKGNYYRIGKENNYSDNKDTISSNKLVNNIPIEYTSNITISSSLSVCISVLTLILILFIYIPGEWFNIVSILTLILFKA